MCENHYGEDWKNVKKTLKNIPKISGFDILRFFLPINTLFFNRYAEI